MTKAATIKSNRGSITFQLSSHYTKIYYPERTGSKYIYFGLPDNDDNQLLARIKLKDLVADLKSGKFDPYNETKYKYVETIEELIQKKKLPTFSDLAVLEWDTKLKKELIHESTYKSRFSYYKAFLDKTPEDITDVKTLANVLENYPNTILMKVILLNLLITSVKWGIEEEKLPSYMGVTLKKLMKLRANYISSIKKNKPCRKNRFGKIDKEFGYYSETERDIIIEAFYNRKSTLKSSKVNVAELVEFTFCTGVRTQEAFALTWGDISYNEKNEMIISINKAYSTCIRKTKGTKTGKIREFKVSTRVRTLLERMKLNEITNKDSLVFKCSTGEFCTRSLLNYWYGNYYYGTPNKPQKTLYPGVVASLYQEGKISKYLNPYQMRASFINHQLLKGKSPLIISKWTGHDAKTLLEHYEKLKGTEESPAD